jgi:hypothetical protein
MGNDKRVGGRRKGRQEDGSVLEEGKGRPETMEVCDCSKGDRKVNPDKSNLIGRAIKLFTPEEKAKFDAELKKILERDMTSQQMAEAAMKAIGEWKDDQ